LSRTLSRQCRDPTEVTRDGNGTCIMNVIVSEPFGSKVGGVFSVASHFAYTLLVV
jgi:hypothetical protein